MRGSQIGRVIKCNNNGFLSWWKLACRSIGRCNNVFTFWCKFARISTMMFSHSNANSQGQQVGVNSFSHSNANSQGQQVGVNSFSHYGANSQGLQISVGTNTNL